MVKNDENIWWYYLIANLAGWKTYHFHEDTAFPIENGDFPANHVTEGTGLCLTDDRSTSRLIEVPCNSQDQMS